MQVVGGANRSGDSGSWRAKLLGVSLAARSRLIERAKRSPAARALWYNRRQPHLIPLLAAKKITALLKGEGSPLPEALRAQRLKSILAKKSLSAAELSRMRDEIIQLAHGAERLVADQGNPEVSVVIPVHNHLGYTLFCLESILKSRTRTSFEIIIVNDGSTDETRACLGSLPKVRLVNRDANEGFIASCNEGAEAARGEYVLFLNNDTYVLPDWLDELLQTLKKKPKAAIAGSKLVFPDGRLQEAGGRIWADGSAGNYGRYDDPNKPEFNYTRRVDYCSGASILIQRKLFLALGKFDEAYAPAYCEDVDLAFKVRSLGLEVIYEPRSTVVHFEGVSCGTDPASGIKSYQGRNLKVLAERWKKEIVNQPSPGERPEIGRDREAVGRILFVDACVPTPDRDAGSVVTDYWIRELLSLGYHVTFIAAHQFVNIPEYTERLERLGVFCPRAPYHGSVEKFLAKNARLFTGLVACRYACAGLALKCLDKAGARIPSVFLPIDLHYLREARMAEVNRSALIRASSCQTKEFELGVARRFDVTCVHSAFEKNELLKEMPEAAVEVSPIVFPVHEPRLTFGQRRDICFVGGFKYVPNVDAIIHFVGEVWPLVKQKIPEAKLKIIGGDAPPAVMNLADASVEILGFVPDIGAELERARLSTAPLRFGAGVKGKVGLSMSYGVPVVGTPTAFEGMDLIDGEEVLAGQTAEDLARQIVRAYTDPDLWKKLSLGGMRRAAAEYSVEANSKKIAEILKRAGITAHLHGGAGPQAETAGQASRVEHVRR